MPDDNFAENPWSREFWNLTRQGEYIKKYGTEVAKTKAKQAGTKLGAPLLVAGGSDRKLLVLIQRRNIGGGGGTGSSGDGPPA